jgi:hypothetical protein
MTKIISKILTILALLAQLVVLFPQEIHFLLGMISQDKKVIGYFAQNAMFSIDVLIQVVTIIQIKEQQLINVFMMIIKKIKMKIIWQLQILIIIILLVSIQIKVGGRTNPEWVLVQAGWAKAREVWGLGLEEWIKAREG